VHPFSLELSSSVGSLTWSPRCVTCNPRGQSLSPSNSDVFVRGSLQKEMLWPGTPFQAVSPRSFYKLSSLPLLFQRAFCSPQRKLLTQRSPVPPMSKKQLLVPLAHLVLSQCHVLHPFFPPSGTHFPLPCPQILCLFLAYLTVHLLQEASLVTHDLLFLVVFLVPFSLHTALSLSILHRLLHTQLYFTLARAESSSWH
jgi:hypothetical protein